MENKKPLFSPILLNGNTNQYRNRSAANYELSSRTIPSLSNDVTQAL